MFTLESSICRHIFWIKLNFWWGRIGLTPNIFGGSYLFLLRRKLKAKVHDHRETEL